MEFKDRVCCICNEHKKFLARVNAGQKLYCMQCQTKIIKEYGMDYFKPCSFGEFLESMSDSMSEKGSWRTSNMFSNIRKTLGQIDEESVKDN